MTTEQVLADWMKLGEGVIAPLLYVFCDDQSHEGRVAKICRFRDLKDGDGLRWSIDMDVWRSDGRGSPDRWDTPARAVLLRPDNTVADANDQIGQPQRRKFEMSCPLCTQSAQGRSETVLTKVGALFDHGVALISLKGLAATLRM